MFTKKDIKFLMKNPEYFVLIGGLTGIIMGYLEFGVAYYLIGSILTSVFIFIEARILYLLFIREKKKKQAIIKHKMNNLQTLDGYQFEVLVANCLDTIGYKTKVTKGSGDYGVDVIAQFKDKKIAIQVKHQKNKVEYKAVQQALSGKKYYSCNEAWVVTSNDDFTRQAKNGEQKLDVKLFTLGDFALFIDNNSTPKNKMYSKKQWLRYKYINI